MGLYGYCTTDKRIRARGPSDAWAYCVLDNDYRARQFPAGTQLENLRVTAAHEYFHAVQFAYDAFEDAWFMEATATWAEDEVYPDINDNLQYLRHGPLGRPGVPLDRFALGGLHHYGAWVFFRYLAEQFPAPVGMSTLIRQMWSAGRRIGRRSWTSTRCGPSAPRWPPGECRWPGSSPGSPTPTAAPTSSTPTARLYPTAPVSGSRAGSRPARAPAGSPATSTT